MPTQAPIHLLTRHDLNALSPWQLDARYSAMSAEANYWLAIDPDRASRALMERKKAQLEFDRRKAAHNVELAQNSGDELALMMAENELREAESAMRGLCG